MSNPFLWSAIATATTFFAIGIFKAKVVRANKIRSGIETVAIGGIAATMAYGIGWLLRGVADNI
jgi:VIT1/CCC1 family predicted Fe2+/Mn2+ transporter